MRNVLNQLWNVNRMFVVYVLYMLALKVQEVQSCDEVPNNVLHVNLYKQSVIQTQYTRIYVRIV